MPLLTTKSTRSSLLAALAALFACVANAQAQVCLFDGPSTTLAQHGLMIARYALGLRGDALAANTGLPVVDAATFEAQIACKTCGFNITGTSVNGAAVVTSTDATIISRKMAGMSGDALTDGLNLGSGTRNTASLVQSFLATGCGQPTLAQRVQAAQSTANSVTNACHSIKPFYWEIGDATAALASGSTDSGTGNPTYTATTVMSIASATKWLYGAYVAEKRGGALSASDIKFLHFHSGYVSFDAFDSCGFSDTVDDCLNRDGNGDYTDSSNNKFNYDGGHMQKLASEDGMGALGSVALAAEFRRLLGTEIALSFSQPQLAGGAVTTAGSYARFLRKVLAGDLHMKVLLGSNAVCTNRFGNCAQGAVYTPTPRSEDWNYSIGHWVDADPVAGDGSFSSTGAFGFHPWIDATRTSYGVLARRTDVGGTGFESNVCGRLLRRAWATGVPQ